MLSQYFGRCAICLITFIFSIRAHAQVTTVKNGNWSSPSTWSTGVVPDINSGQIIVNHVITIPDTTFTIDNVVINNKLTIASGAAVTLANSEEPEDLVIDPGGSLDVYGTLVARASPTLVTTATNTNFYNGSVYRHDSDSSSVIPLATWDSNSTLEITGLVSGPFAFASANLDQAFGNFVYDCPGQTSLIVNFSGRLRNVAGNFTVRNTNGNYLRLAATQDLDLTIGGDVLIEGTSRVWFSMSAADNNLYVGGNFSYLSTSGSISYFTTTGHAAVTIAGDVEIDSPGRISLASGTDAGVSEVTLKNDLRILAGGIESASDNATSSITFSGTGTQQFYRSPLATITGRLNYTVESLSILDIGESVLSNSLDGSVTIRGKLLTAWTGAAGAIEKSASGNMNLAGEVVFEPGSEIEYNGSAPQYLGISHPYSFQVNTIFNNPAGVTLLEDMQANDISVLQGTVSVGAHTVHTAGDVAVDETAEWITEGSLIMNGSTDQSISMAGNTLHDLSIQSSGGGNVQLTSPLYLTGILSISSTNSDLISDGNLVLRSLSQTESASIASLSSGNSIIGDVTVERYMDGIGRTYRYLSSPVQSATVSSWMDDFPITGTFDDPSTGPGIRSANPSMFYYDETHGGLNEGWLPYPVSGLAVENLLGTGLGFCVFIREAETPTVCDVTGQINQGEISLPVMFTDTGDDDADGWNLVGNPYPCAIAWNKEGGWQSESVSSGIAIRDNVIDGFRYSDGTVGDVPGGVIAMGQSFWVKTTGSNPSLVVNESAKTTGESNFYRKKENVDYIEIALNGNTVSDKAFLRKRKGAKIGLDNFDVQKLENDHLTLSIVADNARLAISAVDEMPCEFDVPVTIKLNGVSSTTMEISVNTFGLFENAKLSLYDSKEGITHDILNSAYSFSVSSQDDLNSRFRLHIKSLVPDDRQIIAPAFICEKDALTVGLQNPQSGINYFLMVGNSGASFEWEDSSNSFQVPAAFLPEGANQFFVVGKSLCSERTVSDTIPVEKVTIPSPVAEGNFHCLDGSVNLSVKNPVSELTYHWYNTLSSDEVISNGPVFETPYLSKTKTYYVSASDSNGCESDRVVASAEIVHYDSLTLQLIDGMLMSNIENGNSWFFNDNVIENEHSDHIVPAADGVYKVVVSNGPCTQEALFAYPPPSLLSERKHAPVLYPNPCSDWLKLAVYGGVCPEIIDILSTTGCSVAYLCDRAFSEDDCFLSLEKLPSGIYFLQIRSEEEGYEFIRFVKL